MKIKILIWALLITSNCILAQSDTSRKKSDWLTYNDSDFSISFPRYLKIEFNGAPGTRIILVSPQENDRDSFKENINVISEINHNPDARLEHYVTASELRLKELINGFNLLESSRTQINGIECHKLIYTGRQGKFIIQWEQFIFYHNNRAFILTLTADSGSFKQFSEIFEKVTATLKIK